MGVLCREMVANPVTYTGKSASNQGKLGPLRYCQFVTTGTYVQALPHHAEATADVADSWSYSGMMHYLKYTDMSTSSSKQRIKHLTFPVLLPTANFKMKTGNKHQNEKKRELVIPPSLQKSEIVLKL